MSFQTIAVAFWLLLAAAMLVVWRSDWRLLKQHNPTPGNAAFFAIVFWGTFVACLGIAYRVSW